MTCRVACLWCGIPAQGCLPRLALTFSGNRHPARFRPIHPASWIRLLGIIRKPKIIHFALCPSFRWPYRESNSVHARVSGHKVWTSQQIVSRSTQLASGHDMISLPASFAELLDPDNRSSDDDREVLSRVTTTSTLEIKVTFDGSHRSRCRCFNARSDRLLSVHPRMPDEGNREPSPSPQNHILPLGARNYTAPWKSYLSYTRTPACI
jgi:hypothetical protein